MPGNLGCGSAVLAAITTLAPSFAAFSAIALPIPREAPVMNSVRPANFLIIQQFEKLEESSSHNCTYYNTNILPGVSH